MTSKSSYMINLPMSAMNYLKDENEKGRTKNGKNRLTRQSPWRSLTKTPTIFNGLSFKFATFATWNIKQT